jgi:hypothetical protein
MTDYTGEGTVPVDDAAVSDPPTVDEVQKRQAEEFPEQARTAMRHPPATAEELAVLEAGGDPVDDREDLLIEGPNSA